MVSKNGVFLILLLAGLLLTAGCVFPPGTPPSSPSVAPSAPSANPAAGQPAAQSNQASSQSPAASNQPSSGDMHPLVPASAATPPSIIPVFPAPSAPNGSASPADASKSGTSAAPSPSAVPTAPLVPPSAPSNASASGNDSQYGYKGGVPFGEITFPHPTSMADPSASIPGAWRVYSSRIFYDIGGAGGMSGAGSSQTLNLDPSGTWTYGSSSGTYSVASIRDADWAKWKVDSYGPAYKIVLDNWDGVGADGPIEVSGTSADFIWVFYHVAPPAVNNPGSVQTKFGH